MAKHNNISISRWIDDLLARGAYSFAKNDLHQELPEFSDIAIKRSLNRLSRKGRILSLFRGFYLIIPPQYSSKNILPPPMFLDAFMKYLKRPYYFALLNAAAYHGASHQQPQEFFVITGFPVMRPTNKKDIRINYISIGKFPDSLIEKRNTVAGYINVSNAALTACDLVQFEKRIGGLNRAATVLNELADVIKPSDFSSDLINHVTLSTLQRLGFLLENACLNQSLADALFQAIKSKKGKLFCVPLKTKGYVKGISSNNRWKIIANTEIEIDE